MVIITNLEGKSLPLIDIDFLSRTRGTNGDYEIMLVVRRTDRNAEAFKLIDDESLITLKDGNKFRIKDIEKEASNNVTKLEVTAQHSFYDNVDNYQYDIIEKEKVLSLHEALTHALKGTDITFSIDNRDDFEKYSFENFGDDTSIALFKKAQENFEFEFDVENNTHLRIYKQLGSKSKGIQMRWKQNIVTIKQSISTQNLSTYIKGYGKPKEDKDGEVIEGEYEVAIDYTSPNAEKYGIRHAKPYSNEKITDETTMLRYLEKNLIDYPEMVFEITYENLKDNINIDLKDAELGDTIYLVHEPLNLNFNVRILEVTDYPLHPQLKPIYTISSQPLDKLDKQTANSIDKNSLEKELVESNKNQSALSKRIEGAIEAVYDVENAMKDVDKEMERIENEVLPEIEQAVDSTRIPHQDEPPYPIPNSKLWMDTSVNPPVLKIWDEESETWEMLGVSEEELAEITEKVQDAIDSTTIPSQDEAPKDEDIPKSKLWWNTSIEPARLMRWDGTKWVVLTQTKEEINELMEQMRDEAVIESKEYSEAEIKATRQAIINQLNEEIGDVNSDIEGLQGTADDLKQQAQATSELLDEHGNKITDINTNIDEIDGKITASISDIERIDDTVSSHSNEIEANAKEIKAKLDSTDYNQDKTDILSSIEKNTTDIEATAKGLELRVTKEELENATEDYDRRITKTEATLDVHAESISQKAEKSELKDYVTSKQYTEKVGSLETSINGITGTVKDIEADVDKNTGEISSAQSKISSLEVTADDITTQVSDIKSDVTTAQKDITRVEQTAGKIESTVSSVRTDLESTDKGMKANETRVKQLPDEIDLAVKEGVGALEIGGRNLLPNSNTAEWWSAYATVGTSMERTKVDMIDEWGFSEAYRLTSTVAKNPTSSIRILATTSKHFSMVHDEVYTYSIYIKNVADTPVRFYVNGLNDGVKDKRIEPGESKRVVLYGVRRERYDWFQPRIQVYNSDDIVDVIVGREQVEKGNKPTDWTPAPEDMDARMTATETTIKQLPSEIDLAVKEGVGALEIGGRNLLLGDKSKKLRIGSTTRYVRVDLSTPIKPGETFTISIKDREWITKVKDHDSVLFSLRNVTSSSGTGDEVGRPKSGTIKIGGSITRENKDSKEINAILFYSSDINEVSGNVEDYIELKLEKGNKATDWSPAPEDGVNKTNVLSSINLSKEGVKIEGAKIDIKGLVEFINDSKNNLLPNKKEYWEQSAMFCAITERIAVKPRTFYTFYDSAPELTNAEYWFVTYVDSNGKQIGNSQTITGNPFILETPPNTYSIGVLYSTTNNKPVDNKATIVEGTISLPYNDSTMIDGGKIITNSLTSNQINVNELFANSAVIGKIQSNIIQTTELDAKQITAGTLNANRIGANSITVGKLDVNNIFGNSAVIGKIQSNAIETAELSATNITSGTLNANKVAILNLNAASIMSGEIDAKKIRVRNISAVDITSGTLNASNVVIHGGNSSNYTEIKGAQLTARGTFKQTWKGTTNTYDIKSMLQNGYLRFRNDSEKSSLYYSWYGISTYVDGEGGDEGDRGTTSGSIYWWDTTYSKGSPKTRGITVYSYGGTATLVSDRHHALVKSRYSTDLESTESNIKITTHSDETQRGFTFTKSQDRLNGYLLFGDNNTTGLRFDKSANGIVQVVDASNTTGGSTEIEAGLGTFNIVRRRAGTNYLSLQNENYFRVGLDADGSARVVSDVVRRRTYSSNANVHVTSEGTLGRSTSSERYKVNIEKQFNNEEDQLEHSKKILNLNIKKWNDKFEVETLCKENEAGKRLSADNFKLDKYVGLTSEDVEAIGLGEHVERSEEGLEGIEYDRLWIHLIPVIKEQEKELKEQKQENEQLKSRLDNMEEQLQQLLA